VVVLPIPPKRWNPASILTFKISRKYLKYVKNKQVITCDTQKHGLSAISESRLFEIALIPFLEGMGKNTHIGVDDT